MISKALFFLKAATQHIALGAARARRDFGLATKPRLRPGHRGFERGPVKPKHFGASEMRHSAEKSTREDRAN